jgi:hypothetical protein
MSQSALLKMTFQTAGRVNYMRAPQGVFANAFDLTRKNQGTRSSVACGPQTTFGPSKRPWVA